MRRAIALHPHRYAGGRLRVILDAPAATPSPAQFSLQRDAGTFQFSGTLGNGSGNGSFTFAPSASFAAGLDSHNLHYRDARSLMAAALVKLTLPYIDDIRGDGYPDISYNSLLGFRALGVTRDSVAELRSVFGTMSAENVMAATALHITRAYVDELHGMHVGNVTPERAFAFKSMNITRAYLDELSRSGFPNLPADQILAFKAMHIDAAYLRHLAAHGLTHLTAEQVIQLKAENL